jgi:hypothetical protein
MLLDKPGSGQRSGHLGALVVGWLLCLASLAGCGHENSVGNQDAIAAQDDGACLPGPDGSIGGPPPDNCPNDLPTNMDCPDASPSYQNEVADIIRDRCTVCHRLGGLESAKLFDSYARVRSQRIDMLSLIYHCQMPPTCAPQLTPDERYKLLKWFVCDAMNN